MARLRAFFSLFVLTLGAMLGGLAISGYYEPWMPASRPRGHIVAAPAGIPEPTAVAPLTALQGRLRFLAVDAGKPPPAPAKPKAATKPPAAKPPAAKASVANAKPPVRERSEPRTSRPRQAAAPWPWSLFSN